MKNIANSKDYLLDFESFFNNVYDLTHSGDFLKKAIVKHFNLYVNNNTNIKPEISNYIFNSNNVASAKELIENIFFLTKNNVTNDEKLLESKEILLLLLIFLHIESLHPYFNEEVYEKYLLNNEFIENKELYIETAALLIFKVILYSYITNIFIGANELIELTERKYRISVLNNSYFLCDDTCKGFTYKYKGLLKNIRNDSINIDHFISDRIHNSPLNFSMLYYVETDKYGHTFLFMLYLSKIYRTSDTFSKLKEIDLSIRSGLINIYTKLIESDKKYNKVKFEVIFNKNNIHYPHIMKSNISKYITKDLKYHLTSNFIYNPNLIKITTKSVISENEHEITKRFNDIVSKTKSQVNNKILEIKRKYCYD